MKRYRAPVAVLLILVLLGLARFWPGRESRRFATPGDCVDAYRDACEAGDVTRYLHCLGDPLRYEKSGSATSAELLQEMQGLKGWTRLDVMVTDTTAEVDVDLIRTSGTYRRRFHLQHNANGWVIVGVEPAKEVATPVQYGTHIKDVNEN
jgi:hypothetical protein